MGPKGNAESARYFYLRMRGADPEGESSGSSVEAAAPSKVGSAATSTIAAGQEVCSNIRVRQAVDERLTKTQEEFVPTWH